MESYRKFNRFMLTLIACIAVGAIVFFVNKESDRRNVIEALTKQQVDGRIIGLNPEGRGSYYIEIKTMNDTLRVHSLQLGWYVREFELQIGDSVAKKAFGKNLFFYTNKNGKTQLLFEYKL